MTKITKDKRIEDNKCYERKIFTKNYPHLLTKLENQTVHDLYKSNIIIFPNSLHNSKDLDYSNDDLDKVKLFKKYKQKIKIGNLIGFLGCNNEKLEIHSRFTNEEQNRDYFLIYVLQKLKVINLTTLDINSLLRQPVWKLVQYFFPYYLDEALKKGLIKQYRTVKHNDLNIRGPIDISRLLKYDIPFIDKIAYTNRELTEDNPLIELIRHTIEYLRNSVDGRKIIMNSGKSTNKQIHKIISITPDYNFRKRKQIINYNLQHPFHQTYFKEYRNLQLLCLLILQHQGMELNNGHSSTTGFLFDVSWLWENYVASILDDIFIHLDNRKNSDSVPIYQSLYDLNEGKNFYPDFVNSEKNIILDAKYKPYDNKRLQLNDLRQLISYGYIFKAKKIGAIYPSTKKTKLKIIGILKGYNAQVFKVGVKIPQTYNDYADFVSQIQSEEHKLRTYLNNINN